MAESSPLMRFVPESQRIGRLTLMEDLHPVVSKLSQRLPDDKIWNYFSSTPGETGGRVVFPYCRVDSEVIVARDWTYLLSNYPYTPEGFAERYQSASKAAFKAVAWVEVGFEGLEKLAQSPASVNWTSGVGHFVNAEERAAGIMTGGKKLYDECLQEFSDFRQRHKDQLGQDLFVEYQSEDLLAPFAPNQPQT